MDGLQTSVSDSAHTEMVVLLQIRLKVVHIDDGDAFLGGSFRPGSGAARPSELARESVVLTGISVQQHTHSDRKSVV